MFRHHFVIYICLVAGIVSCGPSDTEILQEAENVVQSCVDELNMQNFTSVETSYPNFDKISRYNLPNNFEVSSVKFTDQDKKEVKVIGTYGDISNKKFLQFVLAQNQDDQWIIERTKGLSSYFESKLFNALKVSGCLNNLESDVAIHQTCQKFEPKFEALVEHYKSSIENAITFQKSGSNLSNDYNISISGEIMLLNGSNISIPGFAYDIYIVFYDRNNNASHTSKHEFNHKPILANDYHQLTVYAMDYHRDYRKYSAVVKITNDQFIRDYVANTGNIDCSSFN